MICQGNLDDHCCHLGQHGVCQHLVETSGERRWVCGLRDSLGSWVRVHLDPRYIDGVKPKLLDAGVTEDCGEWPPPGTTCATCGVSDG